jgi:hypothetical protein
MEGMPIVLKDLITAVAKVTDEEIRKAGDSLEPPKDTQKMLGVIIDRATRAVGCLHRKYMLELKLLESRIEGDFMLGHEEKAVLKDQFNKLDHITDLTKELFWYSARSELHALHVACVGVRRDWVLVDISDEKESEPEFQLGAIPLGKFEGNLQEFLRKILKPKLEPED